MKDPAPPPPGLRILVIEDDRGIAQGVRALLASHGFLVDLARAPGEAMLRLAESAYGLVVADFDLGGDDGVEAIRALRALKPGIPVVAVTAVDRNVALRAAAGLSLAECFEKPVDAGELVRAIARHALRGSAQSS